MRLSHFSSLGRAFTLDGDRIVIADGYEDAEGGTVRTERVLTRAR